MNVKLSNTNVLKFESCEANALNLQTIFSHDKYIQLNKVLSKIFFVISNDYTNAPFKGLNAFLNYIENFFPDIFKQENKSNLIQRESQLEIWNQNEQNQLEELIIQYKSINDIGEKIMKIAHELSTKSLKQIVKKYKELEYSQKNDNIEEKDLITDKEISIDEEPIKAKKNLNNVISLNTTDDIINEIIKIYQEKYANINFHEIDSKELKEQKQEQMIEKKNEIDYNSNDEEDEEEENNQTEKNQEMLDIYLSRNLQPSLSVEDINLFQNILKFGDKFQINMEELSMYNIGLAKIIGIKLLLKCSTCKKVGFESNFQKIDKNDSMLYMGTRCTKCNNEMFSIFKPEYLHEQNHLTSGIVYMIGCFVVDFLPSTFSLLCLKCQENKKVKLCAGNLHFKDSTCHKCFTNIKFCFQSVNITPTFETDLSFLQNWSIVNFSKFNHVIKDDIVLENYVKKIHKVVQEGKPLPLFGTCVHYKKSLRWFRFSCCHKLYPCDDCHNENSEHQLEIAKTILCGYCAFEQPSINKVCSKCNSLFTKTISGNGFWEGGKGCRNKIFMSSKDSHKYTDSKLKTVSKKKKEKCINISK